MAWEKNHEVVENGKEKMALVVYGLMSATICFTGAFLFNQNWFDVERKNEIRY